MLKIANLLPLFVDVWLHLKKKTYRFKINNIYTLSYAGSAAVEH